MYFKHPKIAEFPYRFQSCTNCNSDDLQTPNSSLLHDTEPKPARKNHFQVHLGHADTPKQTCRLFPCLTALANAAWAKSLLPNMSLAHSSFSTQRIIFKAKQTPTSDAHKPIQYKRTNNALHMHTSSAFRLYLSKSHHHIIKIKQTSKQPRKTCEPNRQTFYLKYLTQPPKPLKPTAAMNHSIQIICDAAMPTT